MNYSRSETAIFKIFAKVRRLFKPICLVDQEVRSIVRIAINTRLLLPGKLEGIGWFTFETLKRITRDHPEHQFFYIFDRQWDESFITSPNITPIKAGPQARHPILYYLWFEWVLPRILRKLKADVFLSPDGFLANAPEIPSLIVIHDLNFEHYPEAVPRHDRFFYRFFFPRYAANASRIATVSEFSKEDIVLQYAQPGDKIDVVYNGVNEKFTSLTAAAIEETRKKLCGGRPYFMFIGAQHPRKNLARLFLAFDKIRKEGNDAALVITGNRKWWTADIERAFQSIEFGKDVIFTGRLESDDLHKTLASATALTYISYFEGFGIPILEAFQSGVPVITSNVTAMPEVAGDAAMLVDPFDVDSIAEAMQRVLQESDLRASLISKGLQRVKDFSWDQSAEKLWKSIKRTAEESNRIK